MLSKNPAIFFPATKMPPPAKPAKISPTETWSEIQPKTVLTASQIFPHTFVTTSPTEENMSPKLPICSTALDKKLEMPDAIFERTPENPAVSKPSLREVKKSPRDAAMFNTMSPRLDTPSEPRSLEIALPTLKTTFLTMSNIEKTPLNARFTLPAASSVSINPCVKSRKRFVTFTKSFEVSERNTSEKASLIGLTILEIPSKIFLKPWSKSSRPPWSFQP